MQSQSQRLYHGEYGHTEHMFLIGGKEGYLLDSNGLRSMDPALGGAIDGVAVAPRGIHTGGAPAIATTSGNNSTPVITETYVQELPILPVNTLCTGVELFNGSDVTGNVTVGLANYAGVPIPGAKSASTAGSGTTAYQRIPFASPFLMLAGRRYFLQVQYSSATARYRTHTVGTHGVLVQTSQTYGTLTSFTPPTTFVTNVANIASLY
jgi:hypothetical protein